VIACIGVGFILLALFLNGSQKSVLTIGLAILFLHNLSPFLIGNSTSIVGKAVAALFSPTAFALPGSRLFIAIYSPIPWIGIMLIGFALGHYFELNLEKQKAVFLKWGVGCLALFLLLRSVNMYGDSFHWLTQKTTLFTFLSFINVTKYPPSLQFGALFLGIMFLILSSVQGAKGRWAEVVRVYGKVPLFYFLVHWYLIHPLLLVLIFFQGFSTSDLVFGFTYGRPKFWIGLPLWGVYLAWIVIVVSMYPLCKWYGQYKEAHKEKQWLRYF
jgi:uncharacterized membrane protein